MRNKKSKKKINYLITVNVCRGNDLAFERFTYKSSSQ